MATSSEDEENCPTAKCEYFEQEIKRLKELIRHRNGQIKASMDLIEAMAVQAFRMAKESRTLMEKIQNLVKLNENDLKEIRLNFSDFAGNLITQIDDQITCMQKKPVAKKERCRDEKLLKNDCSFLEKSVEIKDKQLQFQFDVITMLIGKITELNKELKALKENINNIITYN